MQSISCSLLVTYMLDEGSVILAKVQDAAKGVQLELVNERSLVLEGPEQKVDHFDLLLAAAGKFIRTK